MAPERAGGAGPSGSHPTGSLTSRTPWSRHPAPRCDGTASRAPLAPPASRAVRAAIPPGRTSPAAQRDLDLAGASPVIEWSRNCPGAVAPQVLGHRPGPSPSAVTVRPGRSGGESCHPAPAVVRARAVFGCGFGFAGVVLDPPSRLRPPHKVGNRCGCRQVAAPTWRRARRAPGRRPGGDRAADRLEPLQGRPGPVHAGGLPDDAQVHQWVPTTSVRVSRRRCREPSPCPHGARDRV